MNYLTELQKTRSGDIADTQSNRYKSALGRSLGRYDTMVSEMQQAKTAAQAPIATEYGEVADIYRTGGEYGAGAKANVRETAAQNYAASAAAQAATGMSSGSLATGTRARYSRDVTEGIQGVEDIRYQQLGSALQAVAQAKEARGIRIGQAFSQTAQMVSGFQEPTTGQFANQEQLEQQSQANQRYLATQAQEFATAQSETNAKNAKEAQASTQRYQTSERKATQSFISTEAAKYKPTSRQQQELETKKLYIK